MTPGDCSLYGPRKRFKVEGIGMGSLVLVTYVKRNKDKGVLIDYVSVQTLIKRSYNQELRSKYILIEFMEKFI